MMESSQLRTWVRNLTPWVVGALGLQIGLHLIWPTQLASAMANRSRSQQLRSVVPNQQILRTRADSLRKDSLWLGSRLQLAKSRQIAGSDPAARLATQVIPLLGTSGWKLDRVKAQAASGYATLDLGAVTRFEDALQGIHQIRSLPLSIKIRRLSLRPTSSGRLSVDILVAVPTRDSLDSTRETP